MADTDAAQDIACNGRAKSSALPFTRSAHANHRRKTPNAFYAVRPSGSAKPLARQQAVRVLASKQAIVIGPTPPGTGVIAPATAAADA